VSEFVPTTTWPLCIAGKTRAWVIVQAAEKWNIDLKSSYMSETVALILKQAFGPDANRVYRLCVR